LKVPQKLFNKLKGLEPKKTKKEKEQMDDEIRPTWRFAWGLWWRMLLIGLGIAAIIVGILLILDLVGVVCIPWESLCSGNFSCRWLSGV
jgi:hypothetical protein